MSTAATTAGQTAFQKFLNHPAGPKTIHFWAPAMKWALVIAGISDINRPVEQISVAQQASLTATGFIWCRYSMVIVPVNWSLFSVNMFVGGTGLYQMYRIWQHKRQPRAIEAAPASTAAVDVTKSSN
ncbi:UPF0041-domain-containing protein [Ramicandelaber brevisporus]|nr:UPF0041-domain-containing protein [Ramicandelaber brevisporus]KAI8866160.1 UPF0041-domain-containing protein [Ramicandelaber brevisporus]